MADSLLASVASINGNSTNGLNIGEPFRTFDLILSTSNQLDDSYSWTELNDDTILIYFIWTLTEPVQIADESLLTVLTLYISDSYNSNATICEIPNFSEEFPSGIKLGDGFIWRKRATNDGKPNEILSLIICPLTTSPWFSSRGLAQFRAKTRNYYDPFSLISTRLDFYKLF